MLALWLIQKHSIWAILRGSRSGQGSYSSSLYLPNHVLSDYGEVSGEHPLQKDTMEGLRVISLDGGSYFFKIATLAFIFSY